jgi:hypothetical protein
MRESERHNRPRINPINWSLTAILLAACGGGESGIGIARIDGL